MRLHRFLLVGAAVALPGASLAAQLRSSRPLPQAQNLPHLMVANPHSYSALDSSASVRIGAGMRERVDRVADRWFKVILRGQMNEALQQYAYPVDAVLPPLVAKQLAQSLQARAMVMSTMLKGDAGRYTVEARVAGINDDAGFLVRVTQVGNESYEDFGQRVADSLSSAFKALPDAKQCQDLITTAPDKAQEAAAKALKSQPNDGLAEYCLAQLAKKGPSADPVLMHLKNAIRGDPLSLKVWNELAIQYQAKNDSAATIETYQQMLKVAPTNEALRKEAFKLFQNYGKPQSAEEVADAGLALDPANADLWDLKSNACLDEGQTKPEKNKCAVAALEKVFELDTAKADTAFYAKISYAASLAPVDTARFLKWTQMGVARFPGRPFLLSKLVEAYGTAGPLDSVISVTKRLMAVDSSDVTPVLRAIKGLAEGKRIAEALQLATYIERFGDDDAKLNYANLVARGALPLLQTDVPTALAVARSAVKISPKGNQVYQLANYVLGIAAVVQASKLDHDAESTKSCDLAKQMQALVDEAGPALEIGKSISPETAAKYQAGVTGYGPRLASMQKAYCK